MGRCTHRLGSTLAIFTPAIFLYVLASPLMLQSVWNAALFKPTCLNEPAPLLVSLDELPHTELTIPTSNHASLNGWLFPPQARTQIQVPVQAVPKLAIISHGNAGSIARLNDMIASFRAAGVSVLAYDYQGYGKSTGSPSIENICSDGLSVYDYAVQLLGFRSENIVLVGESLGCGVSTEVALRRPCAALILQAGFSSLPRIAKETVPALQVYPDFMFSQRLNNAANLAKINVPVLFVHGTADDIIPPAHAIINYTAARGRKELYLVDGAAHRSFVALGGSRYNAAIRDFLSTLSSPANPSLTVYSVQNEPCPNQ